MLALALILVLVCLPASAASYTAPTVPDSGQALMPEDTADFGKALMELVRKALTRLRPDLAQCARVCAGVLGAAMLTGLLRCFSGTEKGLVNLAGVLVVFGGQVLLGTRARKTRSKSFSAFSSPNYPPLATVQNGRMALYFDPTEGETHFCRSLDPSVGLLKLTPGTDTELLHFMLGRYRALVIESFGVGGLPDRGGAFRAEIQRATAAGRLVALTTQVQSEGTDLSVYSVGSGLTDMGVLEAFDMTPEACFTKLMWILAESDDPAVRRRLFYTPVCHDILPPADAATLTACCPPRF